MSPKPRSTWRRSKNPPSLLKWPPEKSACTRREPKSLKSSACWRADIRLVYGLDIENQTKYSLKVQAIRPKGQKPKLYVYYPLPLAAAIGLEPGEEVEWELLDRRELHLVRKNPPAPRTRNRAGQD